jgi:16S rRNA processing protein RimM
VSLPALVAVGEVVRPHGLRGEVRVRALTDRPAERFAGLGECVLWDAARDAREPCRVLAARVDGEDVLLRLGGVDSEDAARSLAGRLIAVERDRALPPPEGCFYPWQLEGARVVTRDGREVGRFSGIEPGPGQDRWVIDVGGREALVPAVAPIVVDVSVSEGLIVIDPPEGLLEL